MSEARTMKRSTCKASRWRRRAAAARRRWRGSRVLSTTTAFRAGCSVPASIRVPHPHWTAHPPSPSSPRPRNARAPRAQLLNLSGLCRLRARQVPAHVSPKTQRDSEPCLPMASQKPILRPPAAASTHRRLGGSWNHGFLQHEMRTSQAATQAGCLTKNAPQRHWRATKGRSSCCT